MRIANSAARRDAVRSSRFHCSGHLLAALLLPALLLPLVATPSAAGEVEPAFARYLETLPGETQVSVLIYMADQVPIAELDEALRVARASHRQRHEEVVTSLQAKAAATQPPVTAELDARRAAGEVSGYTPYWIANLIVAKMSVAAVFEMAARPDVGTIYSNFTVSPMEPVGGIPPAPALGEDEQLREGIGVTPGLRAIRADRVWYDFGITGAGRLVCGLDTGVMGNHVALTDRWRGNHVPASEAWLDVIGTSTYPSDGNGHGTHTMGTMTGINAATEDTVGVAWGAEWIACNAIDQGVGGEFDNDVITAFQWIADPDGNPGTSDDVPDVVQNSWRINEGFPGGYTDCDDRWWAVIDGAEAAGCAVVFSAGNEGLQGPMTIGSPPDRITTPYNAYAIGALDATNYSFPYPIANFSSRGPSGCDGVTIKPEVSGPGVDVYSTTNNGSYQQNGWSGTSMSGPHVAGIFALMREADPNLDVATMKQVIIETAVDLGTAGEDNTFGWGLVDAYEAVSFVVQGMGEIQGTVTHASLSNPIEGATVTIVGPDRTFTTGSTGFYRGFAAEGTYDVTASHPAFLTGTQYGVTITSAAPITVDFALDPAPDGVAPEISGTTCFFATDDDVGPYAIATTVSDNQGFIALVRLVYRHGGGWQQVDMQAEGGGVYSASIPGQPLDTTVDYYIEAFDAQLNQGTDPPGAPSTFYSFIVDNALEAFADDAEEDHGWTLGLPGDTATTGMWERDDPQQTVSSSNPSLIYQPEDDHTIDPGHICFVTGAAAGSGPGDFDVDGGFTTLLSPIFDVSGAHEVVVRYWRYYTNETSLDDVFDVDISSNGGASWQPLERVGPGSEHPWQQAESSLRCQIDLTDQMQLRFIARDQGSASLTEALIDDLFIGRFDLGAAGLAAADLVPAGRFRLLAAQPNPFNPFTMVTFEVVGEEQVKLGVYDVQGRLVRMLVDGTIEPGVHNAIFDGRNAAGRSVASGTYFLKLEAGSRRATQKLSLVR